MARIGTAYMMMCMSMKLAGTAYARKSAAIAGSRLEKQMSAPQGAVRPCGDERTKPWAL